MFCVAVRRKRVRFRYRLWPHCVKRQSAQLSKMPFTQASLFVWVAAIKDSRRGRTSAFFTTFFPSGMQGVAFPSWQPILTNCNLYSLVWRYRCLVGMWETCT